MVIVGVRYYTQARTLVEFKLCLGSKNILVRSVVLMVDYIYKIIVVKHDGQDRVYTIRTRI